VDARNDLALFKMIIQAGQKDLKWYSC
jgi:hypothetical protein